MCNVYKEILKDTKLWFILLKIWNNIFGLNSNLFESENNRIYVDLNRHLYLGTINIDLTVVEIYA